MLLVVVPPLPASNRTHAAGKKCPEPKVSSELGEGGISGDQLDHRRRVGGLLGALYLVLNLEKAALLAGALLLFALLAVAMRATRDVNWYALTAKSG